MKYLVITPVKDEEHYVEHTLRSMIVQTVKPVRWIVVDDGSSDGTPELLDRYARRHEFIHVVRSPHGQPRQPGLAEIRAFNRGYAEAQRLGLDYDCIVKLDGDVSFETDYFERLLAEFAADPGLGIASGVYCESPDGVEWREMEMPVYHAAGASKMIRDACWKQIDGFASSRAWDSVDEIRAMTYGWRTTHFTALKMKHWKSEGSAIGPWRTSTMHGQIYYLTGGGLPFFLLKVMHRMTGRPFLICAAGLLWGYMKSVVEQRPRSVSEREARYYRALQNRRMIAWLHSLGRR